MMIILFFCIVCLAVGTAQIQPPPISVANATHDLEAAANADKTWWEGIMRERNEKDQKKNLTTSTNVKASLNHQNDTTSKTTYLNQKEQNKKPSITIPEETDMIPHLTKKVSKTPQISDTPDSTKNTALDNKKVIDKSDVLDKVIYDLVPLDESNKIVEEPFSDKSDSKSETIVKKEDESEMQSKAKDSKSCYGNGCTHVLLIASSWYFHHTISRFQNI